MINALIYHLRRNNRSIPLYKEFLIYYRGFGICDLRKNSTDNFFPEIIANRNLNRADYAFRIYSGNTQTSLKCSNEDIKYE